MPREEYTERRSTSRDRDDDRTERRSSRERDDDRGGRDRGSRDDGRGRDRDDRESRTGRGHDDDRSERGSSRSESRGSRYEYHQRSAEDTKRRASQGANEFDKILKDGVKTWKPNDGDNRIRILPPTWDGAKHFGHDIFVHYGVGPDRGQFLCLNKMQGNPDPIEEERVLARRDGDEKYAKELEAKRRVLVYLIDRDHEKEGVQAWAMPWTVDRDIVKVSVDRSSGAVLNIDDPEEGFDVEFEKKGAKDRTEYLGVAIARRSSPLGKSEWLDYAVDNPLPEQLNYFPYDHIAKVFGGGGAHKEKACDDGRDDRDHGRGRDDDRSRDRDDDRSSHGADERRGHGRDDDRSDRRGGRDDPPAKSQDQELDWETIHGMTWEELEDLVDQERLADVNPAKAKDESDLADWICEELKIVKEVARRTTVRQPVNDDADDNADRLRRMREGRGR